MDLQNMDLQGGSLQISTEVIGKIARCAAVEMRDGTAELTLHLIMASGARIPAVAEKVQENVKSAVQNMTSVTVSRVNLVIAGLAAEQ